MPHGVGGLNWFWIAVMSSAPLLAALAVAWPLWRWRQTILGNLAGTAVVFAAALALIARESVDIRTATDACLAAQTTCWPDPSAFTRYAIYASIGLMEVFVLFAISLSVEHSLRRQGYAPEWR
jgi:hypothetical protein